MGLPSASPQNAGATPQAAVTPRWPPRSTPSRRRVTPPVAGRGHHKARPRPVTRRAPVRSRSDLRRFASQTSLCPAGGGPGQRVSWHGVATWGPGNHGAGVAGRFFAPLAPTQMAVTPTLRRSRPAPTTSFSFRFISSFISSFLVSGHCRKKNAPTGMAFVQSQPNHPRVGLSVDVSERPGGYLAYSPEIVGSKVVAR